MSVQTIEFATNNSNNWFTVCYDWDQCNEILEQARKLGVIPSAPRKYTHPNVRWVTYFNSGVNDQFMSWVRSTFTVRNVERVLGAMRSEAALKHENAVYCQRATISRYSLGEVKTAMTKVIGTPAEIREFFSLYNIRVNGIAGLPQCLQLIEELDKLNEVVTELRKPKEEVVPVQESLPELLSSVTDEQVVEAESLPELPQLFAAVDEIMDKPIYKDDDPVDESIDFDPWTVDELNQRKWTIAKIKTLAKDFGVTLTAQQGRMTKLNLIESMLDDLNESALAQHLA